MRYVTHAALLSVLSLSFAAGCTDPHDERAEFMREVEAKTASLDERLQALGARLKDDEVEAQFHDLMANLEEQRAKLEDRLDDVADATEENWDDFVANVRAEFRDLEAEAQKLLDELDDET